MGLSLEKVMAGEVDTTVDTLAIYSMQNLIAYFLHN